MKGLDHKTIIGILQVNKDTKPRFEDELIERSPELPEVV